MVLFHSQNNSNLSQWQVLNDVVMGGRSQANFGVNNQGFVEFSGHVSLENNGGFSSVKYPLSPIDITNFNKLVIKIKGDNKRYQLRLKTNKLDAHSYITYFETSGLWQELEFLFADFYPTYRGRRLELPNFPGEQMEELGFMIANKKAQDFKLEIAQIRIL